jgi:adenosylhomocysteine nucleosidase
VRRTSSRTIAGFSYDLVIGNMKLLLVASDPMEFRGLKRRDDEVRLAENGAGAHHAAAAVDQALAGFRPDVIVSMGFCGALDPSLAIGDIVVGTTIFTGDRSFPAEPPVTASRYRTGPICSIDHVAGTAEEKRKLHTTGAIAVEMEAAGVAQRAQKLAVPFFCVKSVTDLADEDMANDFNAVLRSDGRFDTMNILALSLRRPWVRLPELIRLQRRCALAARSLGEFIAACRF